MQQWTRIKEDEAGFDLNLALVVDAELFRLEAVIRWLDSADGRLSAPPWIFRSLLRRSRAALRRECRVERAGSRARK